MTQEEKQLLLKDLCARLLYEVILLSPNNKITYQTDGNTAAELLIEEGWKPYLRPMSSMTEKEREQLYSAIDFYGKIDKDGDIDASHHEFVFSETCMDYIDWLNAHHFDYRGLIKKGLALKAPEGMYNLNSK